MCRWNVVHTWFRYKKKSTNLFSSFLCTMFISRQSPLRFYGTESSWSSFPPNTYGSSKLLRKNANHQSQGWKMHLRECDSCLGVEEIKEYLITLFDHMIENITFKQWTNVDRSSLETITMSADEFVELFSEKLEALCPHSFIATEQSRLFSECKSTLKPGQGRSNRYGRYGHGRTTFRLLSSFFFSSTTILLTYHSSS